MYEGAKSECEGANKSEYVRSMKDHEGGERERVWESSGEHLGSYMYTIDNESFEFDLR